MKTTKKEGKVKKEIKEKKATFNFLAPHAESGSIAGDFNNWNTVSHPLEKDKKGVWKVLLPLAPGIYQYRFFVDGQWQNDPDSTNLVENQFGTFNCVKEVG